MLVSGSSDTTALLWDLTSLPGREHKRTTPLSAKEVEALWAILADNDAAKAYQAVCQLSNATQQAVQLLQRHLQPVAPADGQRIARLITDLDSEVLAVRQKALAELEQLDRAAESALRKTLANQPSVQVRRQIELLLAKREAIPSSEQLRTLRALEVLEHIGSQEARQVLQSLARGAPAARLTQEAKSALDRLARRPTTTP
jgi:hypothetical protein